MQPALRAGGAVQAGENGDLDAATPFAVAAPLVRSVFALGSQVEAKGVSFLLLESGQNVANNL